MILYYMRRPSHKELRKKLKEALSALQNNRFYFVNPEVIAADALEMAISVEEMSDILIDILKELTPDDYAGQKPPQRSYEHEIKGCDLFPFKYESTQLGCRIYLKIALHEGSMWLVSFHPAEG